MKNRRHSLNKPVGEYVETLADSSSDEMMEDVIGAKVLYNWLYQQEEEKYYLSAKVSSSLPDYSEDLALFVE